MWSGVETFTESRPFPPFRAVPPILVNPRTREAFEYLGGAISGPPPLPLRAPRLCTLVISLMSAAAMPVAPKAGVPQNSMRGLANRFGTKAGAASVAVPRTFRKDRRLNEGVWGHADKGSCQLPVANQWHRASARIALSAQPLIQPRSFLKVLGTATLAAPAFCPDLLANPRMGVLRHASFAPPGMRQPTLTRLPSAKAWSS